MRKKSILKIAIVAASTFSIHPRIYADTQSISELQKWDCSHIPTSEYQSSLSKLRTKVEPIAKRSNLNIDETLKCIAVVESKERTPGQTFSDKIIVEGNQITVCKDYLETKIYPGFCQANNTNLCTFYSPNNNPFISEFFKVWNGIEVSSYSCSEVKTYNVTTKEESAKNLEDLKQTMKLYNETLINSLKEQIRSELKSDTFKSRVVDVLNQRNEKR